MFINMGLELLKKVWHNLSYERWVSMAPRTTLLRKEIIRKNNFLRQVYEEWYSYIVGVLPSGKEPVLELGSGAGYLEEFIPGLITSEVSYIQGVSVVLDGQTLPFSDNSLRAIVATNVLHHLPRVDQFFSEAARCVTIAGALIVVESWHTTWSRFVYSRLHHEPFDPEALEWGFHSSGSLSGANGALPWILFSRDRDKFEREFPQWRIKSIKLIMPFRYLLSGGISYRPFMPGFTFGLWRWIEYLMSRWMNSWAMFAQIVLIRQIPKTKFLITE